jgi:hypothetical protein
VGQGEDSTLYIDSMVVFNNVRTLRYNGEGESVLHLMSANMGCRKDPLPEVLSTQLVRYRKPPHGRKSLYVQG